MIPSNRKKKNKVVHNVPYQISQKVTISQTFRFRVNAIIADRVVTRQCIMSLLACGSVGGLNYITLFSGVKIRKVEIWGTSTANIVDIGIVALEWQDARGPGLLMSDAGTSVRPGHIVSKPPKGGSAEMWSSCNATFLAETLFFVTAPLGSIIDVHVNAVIGNGPGTTGAENLVRTSASVLTGVYFAALDNTTAGGAAGLQTIQPLVAVASVVYT